MQAAGHQHHHHHHGHGHHHHSRRWGSGNISLQQQQQQEQQRQQEQQQQPNSLYSSSNTYAGGHHLNIMQLSSSNGAINNMQIATTTTTHQQLLPALPSPSSNPSNSISTRSLIGLPSSSAAALNLYSAPPHLHLHHHHSHHNYAGLSAKKQGRSHISDEEKDEIRMAFELFDSNKTGKLSYRELKVAMRALDFDVHKAEVKGLMEEHTRDGNTEEVDLDEFMDILILKYKERDPDEELSKAFRFFDEDGTGKITLKNLRKVARDLGEHIPDEELGAMIEEFDTDQD